LSDLVSTIIAITSVNTQSRRIATVNQQMLIKTGVIEMPVFQTVASRGK
jgi:hypothetical protein